MKNKIIKEIAKSIDNLGFPSIMIAIEKPKNKENGDVSTNVAFVLAKVFLFYLDSPKSDNFKIYFPSFYLTKIF